MMQKGGVSVLVVDDDVLVTKVRLPPCRDHESHHRLLRNSLSTPGWKTLATRV